ncbi:ABC transporter permease [Petroclostridium sp. X23]|uniref:ABC transporter permease n=1 Tax=Petroclostridium sp. X23 TaxID=3045146 RepID=UPI0024ACE083|nr:ABC transporter permease [Petroclostridium sp. X23]WHH57998.1 ABC transporter permease [Petroclostridium sp. X23]
MNDFLSFVVEEQDLIIRAALQHMYISLLAVTIGSLIAIPTGIWLTRNKSIANYILGVTGVVQTIPSLVLLGMALIIFGLGTTPALIVLSLYSILPILRNTYTGISEVDDMYIEAAKGMGMTGVQILLQVEIPLALSVIIAGVRISLVYIISWATLAALIGAGGLGDLIWTGLASYDKNMIFAGAIPASILALVVGTVIGIIQKLATPKGLRK